VCCFLAESKWLLPTCLGGVEELQVHTLTLWCSLTPNANGSPILGLDLQLACLIYIKIHMIYFYFQLQSVVDATEFACCRFQEVAKRRYDTSSRLKLR
jgi:hypothetical protein